MASPDQHRAFLATLNAVQQAGGVNGFIAELRAEFTTVLTDHMRKQGVDMMPMNAADRVMRQQAPAVLTDIMMRRLERDFNRLAAEGCVPLMVDADSLTEEQRNAGVDKAFRDASRPMVDAMSFLAEQVNSL